MNVGGGVRVPYSGKSYTQMAAVFSQEFALSRRVHVSLAATFAPPTRTYYTLRPQLRPCTVKNAGQCAILVIFAYNFHSRDPNPPFDELPPNANFYPEKEDGYSYLRRIRRQLSRLLSPGGNSEERRQTSKNNPTSTIYHSTCYLQHAENLPTVLQQEPHSGPPQGVFLGCLSAPTGSWS